MLFCYCVMGNRDYQSSPYLHNIQFYSMSRSYPICLLFSRLASNYLFNLFIYMVFSIPNHPFLHFPVQDFSSSFLNFLVLLYFYSVLEKERIADIQYLKGECIFWFVPLSFRADPTILQCQHFWHTISSHIK